MAGFRPRVLWLTALAGALVTAAFGQDSSKVEYELTIESALQTKTAGQQKPQEISAVSVLTYTVERKAGAEEVALRSLLARVSRDGKPLLDRKMSRGGMSLRVQENDATETSFANAPPALRKQLQEFDSPLAVIRVDEAGAEVGREVVVAADSSLVENGVVANTRLFHAPFYRDRSNWEAPASFSMGNDQFARGTLRYEPVQTAGPDGLITVNVRGELKAEGKLHGAEIKNGLYKVEGQQVYDPTSRSWKSGQWVVGVSLDFYTGGQLAGTASGDMRVGLQRK